MQEGGSQEWGVGSGNGTDWEEGGKEKDTEGNQCTKDVEKVVIEETEWPCSMCSLNVLEDGLECVECEKWCHNDCSDAVKPTEYKQKPFTCPKCQERHGTKPSKTKDITTARRGKGRPKRSNSLPNKVRNKRNIEEVGSPEKTKSDLESSPIRSPNSKKAREEEEAETKAGKKKEKNKEKEGELPETKTNVDGIRETAGGCRILKPLKRLGRAISYYISSPEKVDIQKETRTDTMETNKQKECERRKGNG